MVCDLCDGGVYCCSGSVHQTGVTLDIVLGQIRINVGLGGNRQDGSASVSVGEKRIPNRLKNHVLVILGQRLFDEHAGGYWSRDEGGPRRVHDALSHKPLVGIAVVYVHTHVVV